MNERFDDKDWVRWQFFAHLERSGLSEGEVAEEMGWEKKAGQSRISKFRHGGGWRKDSKEAYRKQLEKWIAKHGEIATPMTAQENQDPYGVLIDRELAEAEVESIVGRLKQLITDLESPALMPWIKASQIVRVFKGVTDEFISIREKSNETTARQN